jgi:hypothetical protein
MKDALTKEQFLENVKNHTVEILRDDGLYRHLKCTHGGSQIYRFDIITWPGHLTICQDVGTYVFTRLPDMFNFFRSKELKINPRYWAEKCIAKDTYSGIKKFNSGLFKECVVEHFKQAWEGSNKFAEKRSCWDAVRSEVLSRAEDGEIYAYSAVQDFSHGDFYFQDFFDGGGTETYTHHYLWCLYAIVWAINAYDAAIGGSEE